MRETDIKIWISSFFCIEVHRDSTCRISILLELKLSPDPLLTVRTEKRR